MTKCNIIDGEVQLFLSALASETRQNLMLSFMNGKEKSVGELVEASGLGQSTISTHLAILQRGGLLLRKRSGKEVYYSPDRKKIVTILDKLSAYLKCCC